MTPGPIEMNIDDLMAKAAEVGAIEPEAVSKIQQWKELIKEGKGMMELLMKLRGMQGDMGAGKGKSGEAPKQLGMGQELGMVIALLSQKYGDITVDELIGKLKAEYGKKRISQLLGGGK